uniref:Phosphoinositide-interacting protein n=1 Tax=Cyprinus carpio TaxID=7962 RepID=A0A8C1SR60_CYPCA
MVSRQLEGLGSSHSRGVDRTDAHLTDIRLERILTITHTHTHTHTSDRLGRTRRHSAVYQRPCEAQGCGASKDMPSVPEHLPLSDCPRSYSREQLTPRSVNTVFSLAHNDTFWTLQPAAGNCEYYWQAILLMTSGGSVLICGMVLSGLYFAGFSMMATNILGPALLSVGLMVLVVGVVLMPITRQMRHQSATKHLCSYYKPHINI